MSTVLNYTRTIASSSYETLEINDVANCFLKGFGSGYAPMYVGVWTDEDYTKLVKISKGKIIMSQEAYDINKVVKELQKFIETADQSSVEIIEASEFFGVLKDIIEDTLTIPEKFVDNDKE